MRLKRHSANIIFSKSLQESHTREFCRNQKLAAKSIVKINNSQFAHSTLSWRAKIGWWKCDHGLPIISFPFNSALRKPSTAFHSTQIFPLWAFLQIFQSLSLIYTSNFLNLGLKSADFFDFICRIPDSRPKST